MLPFVPDAASLSTSQTSTARKLYPDVKSAVNRQSRDLASRVEQDSRAAVTRVWSRSRHEPLV